MYIILRLVCENWSGISVKIIFLWGPKHSVHVAASYDGVIFTLRQAENYVCYFVYEYHISRTMPVLC